MERFRLRSEMEGGVGGLFQHSNQTAVILVLVEKKGSRSVQFYTSSSFTAPTVSF